MFIIEIRLRVTHHCFEECKYLNQCDTAGRCKYPKQWHAAGICITGMNNMGIQYVLLFESGRYTGISVAQMFKLLGFMNQYS